MPFSKLAALSHLTNLDAEVTAMAAFEGSNIVAAVSTDPVKLSVHPVRGSGSKVTAVSLNEASGIALINKMVAVVKSGDDLWALLDIAHSPKIEQVGRDIRSMSSCSAGGCALALGWDGQGTALTLQGNEVNGRQFALRGDVRTADIAGGVTYVVVDGAEGGKFRAHPGTTPESGAVGRADLPAEAVKCDRIVGGAELSAVYQHGGHSVCAVRRTGASEYGAKMVGVGGPVVGVAVISTSLFVLANDGKLRLYDGETINNCTGGPMAATAEIDVRGNGAPSCLLGTTTGGNHLWIGTQGGDVIRCEAAKGNLDI